MQIEIQGHWLRYSTTPNVPTLSAQSSQAKNLALSIFAATHRQKLTPSYQSLPIIMGQLLLQKYTDMAYPGKFDHKFAVKH